jgi:hypothetical protein
MKAALIIAALLAVVFVSAESPAQMLNPYLPHNAVTAEPMEPYNLWLIPKLSRTLYPPCPSPIPAAAKLPDNPPFRAPFPGPLGLPVPVP